MVYKNVNTTQKFSPPEY